MSNQHSSNDSRLAVLETVIGHIYKTLDKIDQKFEKIDQRFDKIDQRFDKIDQRFEKIDQRFDSIDKKFEKVDNKFDQVNNRLWSNFLWLVGLILATSGGLFTMMAHSFHWF